ncbi:MAG: glycoside hydrolase family 20 zincin-like fold domain-containing protein [Candidatus Latescibacterota bacterium]
MYLLPVPKKIEIKEGYFRFSGKEEILLCKNTSTVDIGLAGLLAQFLLDTKKLVVPLNHSHRLPDKRCINLVIEIEHSLEDYRLEITEDSITIGAATSRGLLYGIRTFQQICEQSDLMLPCLSIEDRPDFENRGFYHDISRGKVPQIKTMKLLIEKASRYKLNQIQFYVEHVFAFRSNADIWKGFDVITPDEILQLDEYACSLQIDLVPSLASFGHMYEILQNPVYSSLCELENFDPKQQLLWKNRMEHHTIDVSNEGSYKLIGEMFEDYLPLFSSKTFNICCDETWDLGTGRTKKLADKEGVGELYIGHILRLIEMVQKYDKKVMIWGDIVVKHPELISRLPKDVTLLNWEYGQSVTDDQTSLFGKSGVRFFNCPGVSGWNRLANDLNAATINIRNMVDYGKKNGARGILNTDWGDYGHINPLAGSFHGMIFGASVSWNNDYRNDDDFDRAVSLLGFSDPSGRVVSLLRELGSLATNWRFMMKGISGISQNDFRKMPDELIVKSCRRAPEIEKELEKIRPRVPQDRRIDYDEFIWSARAVTLNGRLALLAKRRLNRKLGKKDARELHEFCKSTAKLSHDYETIWRARNKGSELFRITGVFNDIIKDSEKIGNG